ncbi:MAG: hypothetical protein IJE78_06720 [Bacteroidaceae bacterium]|nr:hypothetical protein [Bacteroidaceae bacterium]
MSSPSVYAIVAWVGYDYLIGEEKCTKEMYLLIIDSVMLKRMKYKRIGSLRTL